MSDLASVLPVPPYAPSVQDRGPREALHLRRMRIEASDEELMLRYGRGDARAFELLYRRARRASRCAARGLFTAARGRNVDRGNRRGDRRRPRDREEPPALCLGEAACEPGEGIMIERRDEELSHIYREAEGPRPPQRVDDNILAASQRVAGTVRRPAVFAFSRRWGAPVAIATNV